MLDLLYKHIFSSNRIFFVLIFFLGGKKKIKWKFRNFHFEKTVFCSRKIPENDFLGAGGCFACFSKNGNFEISILFFFPAQKKKLKQKKFYLS
jgi:hypothetical protein